MSEERREMSEAKRKKPSELKMKEMSEGKKVRNERGKKSNERGNKAGYTATEVACGWAGAIFEVFRQFGQER